MSHAPPQAPNWPDHNAPHERHAPSMLIPGMIVGALLLGVGCLSGLFIGFVGGRANSEQYDDFDYDAGADATPLLVGLAAEWTGDISAAQPFDLVVTITDEGSQAHELLTLDLHGAICDNFNVLSINPEPEDSHTEYGWHEYTYNTTLLANDAITITFTLEPKFEGVHEGEIEAYLDDWSSRSIPIAIPVGPPN